MGLKTHKKIVNMCRKSYTLKGNWDIMQKLNGNNVSKNDKGKPVEKLGRKAMGLRLQKSNYDSQAADHTLLATDYLPAVVISVNFCDFLFFRKNLTAG